jgi:hypothetical protein
MMRNLQDFDTQLPEDYICKNSQLIPALCRRAKCKRGSAPCRDPDLNAACPAQPAAGSQYRKFCVAAVPVAPFPTVGIDQEKAI